MASNINIDDFVAANFELLAGNDSLLQSQIVQEASADDTEEVENILHKVNQAENIENTGTDQDFEGPLKHRHHVIVTDQILDNYASAEHETSTKNQTKWAVNVFKGVLYNFQSNNFHNSTNKVL